MPHTQFRELAYLSGRSLSALATQTFQWTPVMLANGGTPNLGDDGGTSGVFILNGLMVTAWARFRWGGTGTDGGSGRVYIPPPIAVDPNFMVTSNTGSNGSSVGVGQNRNDDDASNNYILICQFNPSDDESINLQRSDNNANGITAPGFFDSDGDAVSFVFTYVADPDAVHTFLGVGGD